MIAVISEGCESFLREPQRWQGMDVAARVSGTPFGETRWYAVGHGPTKFAYFPWGGITRSAGIGDAALSVFHVLRELGVVRVLWVGKVGSVCPELSVGDVVVPDDYIDWTVTRPRSYWQCVEPSTVLRYMMVKPFCDELRNNVACAAQAWREGPGGAGRRVLEAGVYVCTEGPAFESRAEVRALERLGGTVVGHGLVPHVYYAKELDLCFGALCVVSNRCVGYDSEVGGEGEGVAGTLGDLSTLVLGVIGRVTSERTCDCCAGAHWLRRPEIRE